MKTKVLIYCTKAKPYLYGKNMEHYKLACLQTDNEKERTTLTEPYWTTTNHCMGLNSLNGKIVAECEVECEEIVNLGDQNIFETKTIDCLELLKKSCLFKEDLDKYLIRDYEDTKGHALHISSLRVFDKPMKLSEVQRNNACRECPLDYPYACHSDNCKLYSCVRQAPQNMCWVWLEDTQYCLISIRPEWVAKILNGEKTIEVRKKVLKGMM